MSEFDVEKEAERYANDYLSNMDFLEGRDVLGVLLSRAIDATRDEVEREDARLVCKWCLSGRELFREELYPESEFLWWHRIAGEVFECYASPIHERRRRRREEG